MTSMIRHRYLWVGAGFFVSGIACLDLLLEVFCARFPLLFYLIAAIIGLGVGHKLKTWLIDHGALKKVLKATALTVCFLGCLSVANLMLMPPNWGTKCSFRYCARGLSGLTLLTSPFPVGMLDCSALWLCANEFRLNASTRKELNRQIKDQGCPEP